MGPKPSAPTCAPRPTEPTWSRVRSAAKLASPLNECDPEPAIIIELLTTALEAADAATEVHRKYRGRFRTADIVRKGPSDFVSHVDLEAERAALAVIRGRFPDHRILAEEEGASQGESRGEGQEAGPASEDATGQRGSMRDPPVWIVDPLDGTTNYLHGHPMFAASVGVVVDGTAVAGAIVAGATGERWTAARGEGAHRNGERIRTSAVRDLDVALVGTGFPFRRPDEIDGYLDDFRKVFQHSTGIRRGGSAALDLCYLAQGSLDAFWEGELAPWDLAGGCAVLEEAGGRVTRIDGTPIGFDRSGSVLAANSPELWSALDAVLRGRGDGSP